MEKPEEQQSGSVNLSTIFEKKILEDDTRTDLEKSQDELRRSIGGEIKVEGAEKTTTDPPNEEGKTGTDNDQTEEEKTEGKKTVTEEEENNLLSTESAYDYSKVLKNVLGDDFKSIEVVIDGEPVLISEIEKMDEDTFRDVLQDHISHIKEESEKGKVSLDNISDFTKKLIEIEKNGGDASNILVDRRDYGDPLERLDLETTDGLKEAIRLRLDYAGQTPDAIKRLVKSYEEEGVLEQYGKAAYSELKGHLDQLADEEVKRSEEAVEKRELALKAFKKELRTGLGNSFQLIESAQNKLVDIATKKNEQGKFIMDVAYQAHRIDPKMAGRLALFLSNPDEYDKQVASKEVIADKLDTAKRRVVVRRSSAVSGGGTNPKEGDKGIPLEILTGKK